MRSLVVYYTRTGNTRKAAEAIAAACGGDLEEIREVGARRSGIVGWLRAGRDGMRKRSVTIEALRRHAGDYDVVFVGSPVWGWNLAPAIRSYLEAADVGSRPVAFFCTMSGSGETGTFASMRSLVPGANVVGEMAILERELGDSAALRRRVTNWVAEVSRAAGA